ncbi:MAG: hypothetical protein JWR21_1146 [Herminiimonas sp.]|nr:hypothetical protein [Herminiimonas sp.]
MKPKAVTIGVMLAALHAPPAFACGYCVEDKIASVYDHAVITRALDARHQIAFFGIDGAIVVDAKAVRELEALASNAEGADKGSLRISLDSAALAVAFDPRRTSFSGLQKSLEKKLAAKHLSLLPLRVMDAPATMKVAAP